MTSLANVVKFGYRQLTSLWDCIDEPIYICDPNTYEVLYANKTITGTFGNVIGQKCYMVFQGLSSPCPFCTNEHIFGKNIGKSYIWEFRNKINKHWYHCIDKAISWGNGRFVRYEIAIDITERKKVEDELRQSLDRLQKAIEGNVKAIAITAEVRDPYTAGHQRRVTKLACAIAKEMGLPKMQTEGIRIASTLHDIGKLHVPAEILSKPCELTEPEMSLIKTHPTVGYEILKSEEFSWPIAMIVLQHHERLNGSGYPKGIMGQDILLEARLSE